MSLAQASRALTLEHVAHTVFDGGEEKPTLALLSRQFEPGKFHVVSGPSGAGKTTLLSILSLAIKPRRGMIRWGEQNLSAYSEGQQASWRRDNLGLIFQTSRLVSVMNVAEHIRLAAATRRSTGAVASGIDIASRLGLGAKLSALPEQLSGGEKQRVAIAQALCFGPKVLLADEPTASLDNTNAGLVAATLRTFARAENAVVICVSHDRAVIDAADELLVLEKPAQVLEPVQ
jgi:putative ABC transport system ATP-binding protein